MVHTIVKEVNRIISQLEQKQQQQQQIIELDDVGSESNRCEQQVMPSIESRTTLYTVGACLRLVTRCLLL